ncbi:AMP-binding protein [Polynucleobacter sp. HIN7]|nr:AMP-binding protein [Polynucleobacter sp. HIN7]
MFGVLVSRQNPNGVALVLDGGMEVSYEMLHSDIQRLANKVPKGALVFIIGGNDKAAVIFYLACLEKGAVPLLLGKNISLKSLHKLMHTYEPNYLFKTTISGLSEDGYSLIWKEDEYGLFESNASKPHVLHPNLGLLLATSGSTGSAKLVRLSLKNLISNAESISQYLEITPEERAITSLPFNYSYGLSVINSHLFSGASVALTNRPLLDAGFWKFINQVYVTSFAGVPYSYEMLLKLGLERLKMPSIKTLTQAGGRLDPVKVKKIAEYCFANGLKFFVMYGQTEATARISYMSLEDVLRRPGSIGKVIPNGLLRIEDIGGNSVKVPGVVGELLYEGANVSMGYAESLDDLKSGDIFNGILRTGDLASFDEAGYFYIDGRLQRFLKIFGVRISLDSVERVLMDKGIECAAHGSDDLLIISVVNLSEDKFEELQKVLAIDLGIHYSGVRIRGISELPRLINGKVNYQCLSL